MSVNPLLIDKQDLHWLRLDTATSYGIDPYRQYTEQEAARLLLAPDRRSEGRADTSTIKRKRRGGKIPYVPLGDSSVAYVGVMLCDFLVFGEQSVLLWGGGDERSQQPVTIEQSAPSP